MPIPPFIAFDTETATPQGELCSIAMVRFEDGKPVAHWQTLINPGVPIWSRFIECHRIRNQDVASAPSLVEAWSDLRPHFSGDLPVVAHNAAFDLGVLRRNLAAFDEPMPAFDLHCTVKMARRLWPTLPNHKLPTVAAHLRLGIAR